MNYSQQQQAPPFAANGSGSGTRLPPPVPATAAPFSLLVKNSPREVVLVANNSNSSESGPDVALLLRTVEQTAAKVTLNARVQPAQSIELLTYTSRPPIPVLGLLGVLIVGDDAFVGVVTAADVVADIDGTPVRQITAVEFISLSSDVYDRVHAPVARSFYDDDFTGSGAPGTATPASAVHPCDAIMRLLASGTFYFAAGGASSSYDLSRTAQYLATTPEPNQTQDSQFVWNAFMMGPLVSVLEAAAALNESDQSFLINVIQGYVGKAHAGQRSLTIISRMGSRRAGTRYNTRGIDDAGAVANYVETEMIYRTPEQLLSFVQVRGSVPVFWDQPGIQVVGHKVQVTRSRDATRPAFERHMGELHDRYGRIIAVNLVSQDGGGETVLATEYKAQFDADPAKVPTERRLVDFDFHAECKGNNYAALSRLVDRVQPDLVRMMCFLVDTQNHQAIMHQTAVFRVNCVDCLDRTNVVQGLLAQQALNYFAQGLPVHLEDDFKQLWANNGDAISRIYAGTGALKSGFTRSGKRTLAGLLDDSVKSVNRFVINNFQDKTRQDTIDALLGKTKTRKLEVRDPVLEGIKRELHARAAEFTHVHDLHIHVGTYNVNGRLPQEPLDAWLSNGAGVRPDIFAIGFQEIVELTAGQIVSADPVKRQIWQQELVKVIRRCHGDDYVLVCDGQLVGAAIFIFAKSALTASIHSVEMSIVKTGMGGITGNKGGISVSLTAYDTPFCFVTAHFAAGQSNVEDRNDDFATIASESLFKRGRSIPDHDHIVWFGDFNYRVDMENEAVRRLVAQGSLGELLQRDQLLNQRRLQRAFHGYDEGAITFPPTYRYNNGTDVYDTSEKNRIPAWCDRILFQSKNSSKVAAAAASLRAASPSAAHGAAATTMKFELLSYTRAELKVSDHKPVLALLRVAAVEINHARKQAIYKSLFSQRTSRNPFRVLMAEQEQKSAAATAAKASSSAWTGVLIALDDDGSASSTATAAAAAPALPPPSSDLQQWWAVPTSTPSNPGIASGLGSGSFHPLGLQAAMVPAAGPNPWASSTSLGFTSAPPSGAGSSASPSSNPNWSLLD
ncbi:Inositol-1,4,5-trisphosphate 5-phosphatase 1 [Blastocladiella emersonii ATCC 22665]|nr:Inositol-1,4,5-trisphosphate 5-phosphatase 1 [Blastocladiella emersonii ATCC 22665]